MIHQVHLKRNEMAAAENLLIKARWGDARCTRPETTALHERSLTVRERGRRCRSGFEYLASKLSLIEVPKPQGWVAPPPFLPNGHRQTPFQPFQRVGGELAGTVRAPHCGMSNLLFPRANAELQRGCGIRVVRYASDAT